MPPAEPISVTVNDPISGDIQAVCGAVKAGCEFLTSPQGQELIKTALADAAAAKKVLSDAWASLLKLFHG